MDKGKVRAISEILAGSGVILFLLPLWETGDRITRQAFLFAGIVCIIGAVAVRQLPARGKEEKRKGEKKDDA
ncbi:MAG: hypothetical protein ABH883_06250 [Candidatus Omnitrophota bacterium]